MARKGGTTKKFYVETRGIKVTGGQKVAAGTVLTRQGDRWKAGRHVIGRTHLNAAIDGEVYFTHKREHNGKTMTYVHIRPGKTSN